MNTTGLSKIFEGIHEEITEWRLVLLNARSDELIAEREWIKDDGDFAITLKTRFSTYVKPKYEAETVYIEDHVQDVWRFSTQEELDEMIRFLSRMRDSLPPASRFIDADESPESTVAKTSPEG
jgi:hypothetical protein